MKQTISNLLGGIEPWVAEVVIAAIMAAIAIVIALVIHRLLYSLLNRLVANSDSDVDDMVLKRLARPTRYALVALALILAAREISVVDQVWQKIAGFVMPAIIGWIALTLLNALVHAVELRTSDSIAGDISARRKATRMTIFSRIATGAIVVITVGLMLLSIPGVRDIGVTLMASAGLAALAVGAAAQPALKSLISGLQMAVTEPIRIGDMVVIDGYTGRVEEIRMTYVLIRMWDERLVTVPTGRFFEQSFENWARNGEMLTGTVFLHLDPAAEIEPIRAEFERFLGESALWDKRTGVLLMTEAHPESIELRLAMSAATIGQLWQLRCAVREHMLGWLRENMPDALIRHRLEVEAANARAAGQ